MGNAKNSVLVTACKNNPNILINVTLFTHITYITFTCIVKSNNALKKKHGSVSGPQLSHFGKWFRFFKKAQRTSIVTEYRLMENETVVEN